MNDHGDEKVFRTLRGFIEGEEPEEETYFAYSATLRIFGLIPDLEEITRRLGVAPTRSRRRTDPRRPELPPWKDDMWSYMALVPEDQPLQLHIDTLWNTLRDHTAYLLELKQSLHVDVFLGYRSNCDHAGVDVPAASLEMFTALQVPFSLSIIIT